MKQHDSRRRLHIPVAMSYRGKADSVDVKCSCGFVELVALWDNSTSFGDDYGYLQEAIRCYLRSIECLRPKRK